MRNQFDKRTMEKSWQYYEPKTIHDSSLSYAAHGMVAAYIKDIEAAYRFFKEASMIDMGPNPISSNMGVHAASMGGIWMMVVLGFGGVFNNEGNLELNPLLPDEWSQLGFHIHWRGEKLHIEIRKAEIVITTASQAELSIRINGKRYVFTEKLIIQREE
jgi:hypothetical glycosyl hydrolase